MKILLWLIAFGVLFASGYVTAIFTKKPSNTWVAYGFSKENNGLNPIQLGTFVDKAQCEVVASMYLNTQSALDTENKTESCTHGCVVDRFICGRSCEITTPGPGAVFASEIVCKEQQLLEYEPKCGDFLTDLGVRNPNIKFLGCKPGNHHQLRALLAEYEVSGSFAKEVEQDFIVRFGIPPLKFLCCGWEGGGGPTSFKDGFGNDYSITFTSEETVEKDWTKIAKFRISISKLLELP